MAKAFGEKLKILYLRDYLLKYSDEDHPVTLQNILSYLADQEIPAERKSIYRDLKILGKGNSSDTPEKDGCPGYGMDIVKKKDQYYIRTRDFTLQEVKILIDMVQSSNSITKRKVYVRNRVKVMNESVYRNVDRISEAINNDEVLHFQYFTYNLQKQKELRHQGKKHIVSPFALIWVDQNYYLLGYNHEYREIRPFRVDRMTSVSTVAGPRQGKKDFEKIDIATFTTKVFHMYTGEIKLVQMRFQKFLVDAVIDRFGEDVMLSADGENAFIVSTEVAVSPQFYGWLAGFGKSAEILAPESVRQGMKEHIRDMMALYS